MIYANRTYKLHEKEMQWGTLKQIIAGEEGRGRKAIYLPSEYEIEAGNNKQLSVGSTKTNKPRIISGDSSTHLILSSEGGYTRRGNGKIHFTDGAKLVASGNGADGDAGRIGQWSVAIFQIFSESYFVVKKGGSDTKKEFYRATAGSVIKLGSTIEEAEQALEEIGYEALLDYRNWNIIG